MKLPDEELPLLISGPRTRHVSQIYIRKARRTFELTGGEQMRTLGLYHSELRVRETWPRGCSVPADQLQSAWQDSNTARGVSS